MLKKILTSPKKLLVISQPSFWLISALVFGAGYLLAKPTLSINLAVGFLFFCLPFNLLFRGLDKIYRPQTEDLNSPKQVFIKKSDKLGLIFWITALNLPFVIFFLIQGNVNSSLILVLLIVATLVFNIPPLRLRNWPFVDTIIFTLCVALPFVFALSLGQSNKWYIPGIICLCLWSAGTYILSNIYEIQPNRAVKIRTISTLLGAHNSALLSFWAYTLSALLCAIAYFPYGILASGLLATYALNVSFFLKYKSDAKSEQFKRAWQNYIFLNYIVFFWLTILLLFVCEPTSALFNKYALLAQFLIVLSAIQTGLIIHNLAGFRRPSIKTLTDYPSVSILIHAYNQADNISSTILAALGQNYPDYEIIFTDLGSVDNTSKIVNSYQDEKIKVIQTKPIAQDWSINAWASEQLLEQARGDVIVLLSADTVLLPDTIGQIVSLLYSNDLDIASILPADQNKTIAQKLLLNLNRFFWFGLYPTAYLAKNYPEFSAAYSGLMVFRKQSLASVGGFELVKKSPLEDLDLASRAKKRGLKTGFWLGSDMAIMQNHASFRLITLQSIQRYYPMLHYNYPLSIAGLTGGFFVLCLPFLLLLIQLAQDEIKVAILLSIGITMAFVNRLIVAITSRQSYLANLLYPITSLFMLLILFVSILNYELFKPRWTNRTEI